MIIKGSAPKDKQWPGENFIPPIIGNAADIRQQISSLFPEVNWNEPLQGSIDTSSDIVFVLPGENDISSIDLEVGHRGNPSPILQLLCDKNGWCVFDLASAEFIDLAPTQTKKWWQFWK